MKQIWLLTKIQLHTAFDFNLTMKSRKIVKKKNYTFRIALLIFVVLMAVTSFIYSYSIGTTLKLIGMLYLLPELMMAVTSVVTFMTTIYKVKGTLFGFKDYDMIMSLPVKESVIVISRFILLYSINITFTLIIMLPAAVAYGILSAANPLFYAASLLTVLFIPVIPMIAAAVMGTLITIIASRFRHSNLFNLIITFAFLGGFMIFGFRMDSEEALGQMSSVLTKQIDRIYPLAAMYRRAVCELNPYSMLTFLFISGIALMVFAYFVGIKFKAINTGIAANRTKSNYKIGALKQGSPFKALYQKELKRFFSSSLYIMNTAFGIVMMTIGALATLFLSPEKLAQILEIPQMSSMAGALSPLIVSMCVSMTFITACSISLEGRNLWILKTSPVSIKTIFLSKIAVNLTITLPAVFLNGILIAVGLKLAIDDIIVLFLMPVVYAAFTAVSGLVINLLLPKLDWTSEVSVIKQSAASMIATFGGIAVVALPIVLLLGLSDIKPVYINAASTVVIALMTCFLYHYLNTKGEKLFQSL